MDAELGTGPGLIVAALAQEFLGAGPFLAAVEGEGWGWELRGLR